MELEFIDISKENKTSDNKKKKTKDHNGQKSSVSTQKLSAITQNTSVSRQKTSNSEQRRRRKKRRRKKQLMRAGILLLLLCLIIALIVLLTQIIRGVLDQGPLAPVFNAERRIIIQANETEKPEITEDFLTVNPYSRPGDKLGKVKNIFVHYTANPGTSAAQNRSYFENLGITHETSASAHFVIGYEGEIVQCIPLDEIGYAVKTRNEDSISIECCYLNEDGRFTAATYETLLHLCAWLLNEYDLTPSDVLRHYDEGGKLCPLYYVEHEDAWEGFLEDLENYIMREKTDESNETGENSESGQ